MPPSLQWLAVPATIALLVVLPLLMPTKVVIGPEAIESQRLVREAIDEMPFIIGARWAGKTVPVPPEAMEMLRPNAILSREYRDLETGRAFALVVVHSTEMQDMLGHYPPICYPSAGWTTEEVADREIALDAGALPIRAYRFHRASSGAGDPGIRVLNGFVLPNGSATVDMDQLRRRAERRSLSALGVAQIQLVSSQAYDESVALEAMQALLNGADGVLEAIGFGQEADEPSTEQRADARSGSEDDDA